MKKLFGKAAKVPGLVIQRTFDAPPDLFYEVFTQADHMKHWKSPRGFEMTIVKQDLTPGGMAHYSQTSPDGQILWNKFDYIEIVPNEKLVYTNSFSDEEGNTLRAPFSEMWPLRILNTITFQADGDKTGLTLHGKAYEATKKEIQFFESFKENNEAGFADTFELLDEYLEKLQR